jgi:hypothetical protein
MGVKEATDSGLIPVQEADELATIEVRIDQFKPLLSSCFSRVLQDPVNGPGSEGEALGAPSQTPGQLTSSRLPHVVEAATPGATLEVVRLTE